MKYFVFFAAFVIVSGDLNCDQAQDVICSNEALAKTCNVVSRCPKPSRISSKDAALVDLALYYDTLCPDSRRFFQQQLWPTFQSIGRVMNITIVPYGIFNETQVGGTWKYSCNHGPNECWGNLLQTCVNNRFPFATYFPFAACIMSEYGPIQNIAITCAQRHYLSYERLEEYMNYTAANDWQHQYALKTKALNPRLTDTPWVTINGVHTADIELKAETDLLSLICSSYEGEKPTACAPTVTGATAITKATTSAANVALFEKFLSIFACFSFIYFKKK